MKFKIQTKGHYDFVDITERVAVMVKKSGVQEGVVLVFVAGSTAALTTMEYEDGLIEDMKEMLEKLAPENFNYRHHQRWGDRNGAAHLKAALIGPDLVIPIEEGELKIGQWQQIVLIDFDERPREREIIVKIIKDVER